MALLTTEDVLNKKFQYVKFREGYDQDEVDEFLDEVVEAMRQLEAENADLKAKLEAANQRVAELGFKTLQIDDGWEVAVGDWEAGESFGDGMEAAATRIREAGMQPGLWVAPFIALPGSRAARDYPEMFVHNADGGLAVAGSNWGGDYYALDTTHPTAQTYVRKLIAKIVHRWGFSYLKLDFINAAAIPGYRHRQIDRAAAYRTGLRLVPAQPRRRARRGDRRGPRSTLASRRPCEHPRHTGLRRPARRTRGRPRDLDVVRAGKGPDAR